MQLGNSTTLLLKKLIVLKNTLMQNMQSLIAREY